MQDFDALPLVAERTCPIEVVVKAAHVGTPRHRYYQIDQRPTRDGTLVVAGEPYPCTFVRFDWRNPLQDEHGQRLADEPLPEEMAVWWIDTRAAGLARRAFAAMEGFLAARGLRLLDICFFIDAAGRLIFSEVSPDCMRVTAQSDSLDKDIWRAGGSSALLLEKWSRFVELIR
jgi:phosphoribosylaminoimidazole-succinocarboxamide synthase